MINLMMIYDGQPVTICTINCTTRCSVHAIVDARTLHILGRDILEDERSSTQARDSSITPMTPPGIKKRRKRGGGGEGGDPPPFVFLLYFASSSLFTSSFFSSSFSSSSSF